MLFPTSHPEIYLLNLRIRASGLSHAGRVRPGNEDALVVEPSRGLLLVADGMGGAPGGEVASALAVQAVARGLHAGRSMAEVVREANRTVWEKGETLPRLKGMGTTLTALQADAARGVFSLGHVGDSRAYRWSSGALAQLTRDHTMVEEWVEEGRIGREAARGHPLAHILTRALGVEEEVEVELLEGRVEEGDRFLLCSDGLVKVLEDRELAPWVAGAPPARLDEAVRELVEEANRRGGPDNVTVALLVVQGPGSARARRGRAGPAPERGQPSR